MHLKLSTLLFAIFISFPVCTQVVFEEGTPPSLHNDMRSELAVIEVPALDYEQLDKEDQQDDEAGIPYRFGYVHDVVIDINEEGTWETLANGDRVWRYKIIAPDATSINLNYNLFDIPVGTELYVYGLSYSNGYLGPFTYKNVKENKEFATGLVNDSICIVEVIEPRDKIGQSKIEISGIVHGYRSFDRQARSMIKRFQDAGSCNYDVGCPIAAGWEDQIKSVAMILTSGNNRICTGALINNTNQNCQAYFLTAEHCFSNRNPGDVLNNIFMFNYDSPTPACPGIPSTDGPVNETVQGGTVIAEGVDSDFFLIELTSNPIDFYDVYYSGWNRQNSGVTDTRAIHHPSGDVKKFSEDVNPANPNGNWGGSPAGTHWIVVWDSGTTEGGSSGSPLYDQNKRIIGDLTGGGASCNNPNAPDYYGSVWYSWDQNGNNSANQLQPWLDPSNGGAMFIDGTDCSVPDNYTCDNAELITSCGIHTALAPDQGNGANNGDATNSVWYQFFPNHNGTVTVRSCDQGVNTRLWVYSGSCSSLTLLGSSDDDCQAAPGDNLASEVLSVPVSSGVPIYIEWDDRWSNQGFDFEIICEANYTCATAEVITTCGTYTALPPTQGSGANQGGATHAVWYEFIPNFSGPVDIRSCGAGVNTRLWVYTGTCGNLNLVASSDDDCSASPGDNLASIVSNFSVTAGVPVYLEWDDRWSSQGFDFTIACPNNYTCVTATVLPSCGTYAATPPNQGGGASQAGANNAAWYAYIPTMTGTVNIYSCNGGTNTRLWVYSGNCSNLTLIASSDNDCAASPGDNLASQVSNVPVTAGVPIYFEWDDRWSNLGFNFTLDCGGTPPPCPPDYAGPNALSGIQNTNEDFETDGILQSTQQINADVDYDSGTHIDLLQGFEVFLGQTFNAFIDGCGNLFIDKKDEEVKKKK